MKYILMVLAFAFVWGCSSQTEPQKPATPATDGVIEGTWMKEIVGQPGQLDGMTLQDNGYVQTINMYTLTYRTWHKEGNTLTLTGLSVGNGNQSDFTETFNIKELTDKSMVLELDGQDFIYTRHTL